MVSGASSGIGREISLLCESMGATMLMIGRNEDRLSEVKDSMKDPGLHQTFASDLTVHGYVESMALDLKRKKVEIHGLVHAAGISAILPFRSVTPEKMEQHLAVNVVAGMNLTRVMVKNKLYSANGMSVLFIASVMGMVGEKGRTLYGMTKGALLSGMRSLALELADRKIRVNAISPGVVRTPMSDRSFYSKDEQLLNEVSSMHPLGLGSPQDVAHACLFLLSDEAGWITGSNLVVDGGYTAH